jgi:hypothetical protein
MTNQLPDDISFDRWVQHVFDHPVPTRPPKAEWEAWHKQRSEHFWAVQRGESTYDELRLPESWETAWYFKLDAEFWYDEEAGPTKTVHYLTALFTDIDTLTVPYTDTQINQGINYLISNACSNYMFALLEAEVPLSVRIACVQSFYDVYAKLYAVRCTSPELDWWDAGHNPLNTTCYMWWDMTPFYGKSGDPVREQLDEPMLEVMVKTLQLKNDVCRQGALHGLGHWQYKYREFVRQAINQFLEQTPDISDFLHDYAIAARAGRVQ